MVKDYYINYYFLFLSTNRIFPQKVGGHYAQCSPLATAGMETLALCGNCLPSPSKSF